ncbi:hypothetical protein FACS1894204_13700 [Synergistales bacterium]|nr:hypothetical protein FACS1894204_13700 [Synergistales bacterium]
MNWIRKFPLRKVLAGVATLWALILCSFAWRYDRDLGTGVTGVLQAIVVTAIGGYTGSSAWEAVKNGREGKKE